MWAYYFGFIAQIVRQRDLIWTMTRREVLNRHIGSFLGFVWTFIHPIIMIFIYWMVFSVGFRMQPAGNVPFVVWLTAGLAIWFVFAESISGSAEAIVGNAPLIKKTRFPSQFLPIVKALACLVTHCAFILVLVVLLVFNDIPIRWTCLQFLYYLAAMEVLLLGIGWAVAALNVFIRDIGQIVTVLLQIAFWTTPILWDIEIMPARVQSILKLNPLYYPVQGYRESFLHFVPFWQHGAHTAYFWGLALAVFVLGGLLFKRLKPQFADVL